MTSARETAERTLDDVLAVLAVNIDLTSEKVEWANKPECAAIIEAAILAERERCAKVADAYAEENIQMAGDTVLLSPAMHGDLSTVALEKERDLQIDGCVHSAMFHAAQNIAAAIREDK